MSDDIAMSALSHGGSLVGGGLISTWAVKVIFGGFKERLDKIEETLEGLVRVNNERHEQSIVKLSEVNSKADAAHKRIDDLLTALENNKNWPKRRR